MEPNTLIMTALAFGASGISTGALGEMGKDAYTKLKAVLAKHFAGDEEAEHALKYHEKKPESYEKLLMEAIRQTGVDRDDAVLAQAKALLAAADPAGTAEGKYVISSVSGGVNQFGNHNEQTINIGMPPSLK